jgi:TolB-like protein
MIKNKNKLSKGIAVVRVTTSATLLAIITAGCSMTEQVQTTPAPIIKTSEEHVCVDARAQVIQCPDSLGLEGMQNSKLNPEYAQQLSNTESDEQERLRAKMVAYRAQSASASQEDSSDAAVLQNDEQGSLYVGISPQHSLSSAQHSVLVSEYIEQIASQLMSNIATDVGHAVVGVTSFVDFNNDLATLTPLGNRVAEHFYTNLFQQGFTVADYKVRNQVSVTSTGDFVFSRNVNKLDSADTMTHVLTGTIMYQQTGLLINARIVNFDTKWVVSTASGFIPYFVLDKVVPASAKHTVM